MGKRIIASLVCMVFLTLAMGVTGLAASAEDLSSAAGLVDFLAQDSNNLSSDGNLTWMSLQHFNRDFYASDPISAGWSNATTQTGVIELVAYPYAFSGGTQTSDTCTLEQLAAAFSEQTVLFFDVEGKLLPVSEYATTAAWQAQYYAAFRYATGDLVLGLLYYQDPACDRPVKGVLTSGWKPGLTDLVLVAQFYSGATQPTAEQLFLADMNNEGTISLVDLIWMARAYQIKLPDTPPPAPDTSGGPFGAFEVEGIEGGTYTNAMFAEHDLTIVNVVTTWCGDCKKDLPILAQLSQSLTGEEVAVVGIVYDARKDGQLDQAAIAAAKGLIQQDGITFPMLIPDVSRFNGLLDTIEAVPTAYFIGRDGQQVAEPLIESVLTLDEWHSTIDQILNSIQS